MSTEVYINMPQIEERKGKSKNSQAAKSRKEKVVGTTSVNRSNADTGANTNYIANILSLRRDTLVHGIILSEILGKPKAFSKKRT